MNKIAIIEVGSANTKTMLYENGIFTEPKELRLEVSNHHKKLGHLDPKDVDTLCDYVKSYVDKGYTVRVVGTSLFRSLGDSESKKFLHDFKTKTGIDFEIVTAEQEGEYTVKGVLGNDYKGRLAVMIGGGKSTEVYIVENKQIIERHHNMYGAYNVSEVFPNINDHKPNINTEAIQKFCEDLTQDIKNKSDILVLAGGDHLHVWEAIGKDVLEPNRFYKDELQPYQVEIEKAKQTGHRFVMQDDLDYYRNNFNVHVPEWWNGCRQMRFCVVAVANKVGAKFLIPTRINMCLGIINEMI